MRIVTGEAAFNSTQLNRGPGLEPARMAGVTILVGKVTFGGGAIYLGRKKSRPDDTRQSRRHVRRCQL